MASRNLTNSGLVKFLLFLLQMNQASRKRPLSDNVISIEDDDDIVVTKSSSLVSAEDKWTPGRQVGIMNDLLKLFLELLSCKTLCIARRVNKQWHAHCRMILHERLRAEPLGDTGKLCIVGREHLRKARFGMLPWFGIVRTGALSAVIRELVNRNHLETLWFIVTHYALTKNMVNFIVRLACASKQACLIRRLAHGNWISSDMLPARSLVDVDTRRAVEYAYSVLPSSHCNSWPFHGPLEQDRDNQKMSQRKMQMYYPTKREK
jgi:hypothetical protein